MNPFKPYLNISAYGRKAHPERPWWRKGTVYGYEGDRAKGWSRDGSWQYVAIADEIACSGHDPVMAPNSNPDELEDVVGCHNCHHRRWVRAPRSIDYADVQRLSVEELMAQIDTKSPRPCPPPMNNQVWAECKSAEEAGLDSVYYRTVESVEWRAGLPCRVSWKDEAPSVLRITCWSEDGNTVLVHKEVGVWPPPDHVLVDGPGAPWAPPDWHADG